MPNDGLIPISYMPMSAGVPEPPIDIGRLLGIAAARWKLIVITALIALLATYSLLLVIPHIYKSTVEILIFDPQRQIESDIQRSMSPFHDNVDAVAMSTEIQLIQSNLLALRVAEKLGLDQDQEFLSVRNPVSALLERLGLKKPEAAIADSPGNTPQAKALRLDRAAALLRQRISVERVQASYMLAVTATASTPAAAQRLAAAIADEFLSNQREARQDALQEVMTWVRARLVELQDRIQGTEDSIKKIKAASGLSDFGSKVTDQQITELSTQLMAARSDVALKQAHFEQANRVLESKGNLQEIPEIQASTAINQLRQQALQLSWQEAKLRSELGPAHEAVVAIHNRLSGVNGAIDEEALHVIGDLRSAYNIAVERQQSLETNLQSLTNGRGNSEDFVKLQKLTRVLETDRKLYESYLSQSTELSTSGSLQEASTRIVSPANLPGAASSPQPLKYYAFSTIFGLGLGFLLAFLLENFRRGVKTGADAVRAFGYPVLGALPLMLRGKRGDRFQTASLVQTMVDAPLSEFGEAVRTTRLGLQFSDPGQTPSAIVVTSAVPGEGKSAAAMLLAASSAASGGKTVLVDCDLRHQSLSEAFGSPRRGLADLLLGTADISEVTIQDPQTGVYVIPTGAATANVADLLASQRMRELMAKLREHYDYIVLDASPVLPVIDALALASVADKILVVVEWGRTPRDIVVEAFNVLRPEAHRIAGIMLNKVDPKQMRGYGYGYGH